MYVHLGDAYVCVHLDDVYVCVHLDDVDNNIVSIPTFTPVYHHIKDLNTKSGGLGFFVKSDIFQNLNELKYSGADCVQ